LDIKNKRRFYENLNVKFIINIDFIKEKIHKKNTLGCRNVIYYLNLNTFNRICMTSHAKNAIQIRNYFIILQNFIHYTQNINKE